MINFDSLCLKYFGSEFAQILTSGRIQKIQQPSRKEIILNIRSLGQNYPLYININPQYPHLCVMTKHGEKQREVENPQKPPMFCMLLRKYIEGSKIKKINIPNHERIFEIFVDSYSELGDTEELVLSVELMGKYSNIILYKNSDKTIIGCAHNIGSEKSRVRELSGGLPYIYPEQPQKKDILSTSKEEFFQDMKLLHQPVFWELNQLYFDISVAMAKELCDCCNIQDDFEKISAIETQKIFDLYDKTCSALSSMTLNPSISSDKSTYSIFSLKKEENQTYYSSINEMLNDYFGHFVFEDKMNKIKNKILNITNKNIKYLKKEIEKLTPTQNDSEKAIKYKQIGDILAANLYMLTEKQNSVTLKNFYDNNNDITIPLNPSISINDNIQKYYKLHSKAKTAMVMNKQRIEKLKEDLYYFLEIQTSTNYADKISTLLEIKEELVSQKILEDAQHVEKKQKTKNTIELDREEINGYTIFIGKNNKQNDYIVSKISRPNDIWMHAQNMPGSHILIKLPPGEETPPDNILLRGAQLAAYYSQGRNSKKVEILYTKRKYLKKPPGAKPGYVTYTEEKTIVVD